MKQTYLFIIILSIVCSSLFAQEKKTTLELLKSHTWRTEDQKDYAKFDNNYYYMYHDREDIGLENFSHKYSYHLTDNIVYNDRKIVQIDPNLVGKTTEGKYLVIPGVAYRIDEISETSLILFPVGRTGAKIQKYKPYAGPLPGGFPQ